MRMNESNPPKSRAAAAGYPRAYKKSPYAPDQNRPAIAGARFKITCAFDAEWPEKSMP
jgi:hypothetical protein